jgi:large subunit ribosomal protein L25
MADYVTLPAQTRTVMRKKTKQLRREGITPIAVYGRHTEPASLQVDTRELARVLASAGSSALISIEVEGEAEPRVCLARDAQRHVTRQSLLHADFLQVAMDEVVTSDVALQLGGEPEVVRANEARLDVLLNLVSVEALPADLPPVIEVDVSGLEEIGDSVLVGDLDLGDEVTILTDPEDVIARLSSMHMEALEELEEEEAEAEEGEEAEEEAAEGDEDAADGGTAEDAATEDE